MARSRFSVGCIISTFEFELLTNYSYGCELAFCWVEEMIALALLFLVVYAINLIPAFAPPTWMVLTLFGLSMRTTSVLLLATVGAAGATLGRLTLAKLSGAIIRRRLLSARTIQNIDVVKSRLEHRRMLTVGTFLLYALSPLPSNYLFIAYGLTTLDLRLIVVPFFLGRVTSYTFFVFSAATARRHLILEASEAAPFLGLYFVVSQILLLSLVYVFAKIDWGELLSEGSLRWLIRGPTTRDIS